MSLTPKTQIESIYPLSPTQQGMLFHTLYAPNSGVYFVQSVFTLSGDINVLAFEQAWRRAVELHPILRTLFVWENRQHPLQVVCKTVNLPWNNSDWRSLSSGEQEESLLAFLQAERERGFELDKAPLMRCTLIRVADNTYQFILSHHHLLMDGWCLPIVLKEVWAFYQAFDRGENLYLNPPPPYRNYIAWLRQQDSEASQKFWRSTLAGFTAPTPLIVDKLVGNLSEQKAIYDEQNFKLSASLTDALKELARQNHLTLNTLVQGAWALLLSRYSGELDVVFGATVSGRSPALLGVESMVGLFINTLPVRVQVSPETELLSWLKQLQVSQVEREQYSYSSLVEIQGVSDVPRILPLFNSIVVFENYPVDSSLLEGKGSVEISNVRGFERTNYPLTVVVVPDKELSIQISYDTSRFDGNTISRMLGHLQTILEAIVANPKVQISKLPMLTEAERQQLLVEWNNTQTQYSQDKCIHQLFEEQVENSPDAIAVVFKGKQLTYRELNARANQLAYYLQELGVEPEVLVGICVERSLEMVVGLLGILKAGGAYVPLDPAYPSERLAYMLSDSQVQVLLTNSKLVNSLPTTNQQVICLDKDWGVIREHCEQNPKSSVQSSNLAYVIYTSGSTGKPKGTMILHKGVVNYLTWCTKAYQVGLGSGAPVQSSLAFDATVTSLFSPLLVGQKVVLLPEKQEIESLCNILCSNSNFSLVKLTPAHLELLNQLLPFQSAKEQTRALVIGGEALLGESLSFWRQHAPNTKLINEYGPTETVVGCCVYEVTGKTSLSSTVLIGRPIANTQLYVLDKFVQPVPIGVWGELHIGGDGLARGYLNRPDLTNEKFIPNPFGNQPGKRLYKTGDLVRYLPDGNIEFFGRIDNQVKIRGFRIELGEIEAAICQHPIVLQNVVIVREDIPSHKSLVAYIVSNQPLVSSDLRSFLKEKLPDHMIPGAFVMLDTLPLTPNGKVDRFALPKPETVRQEIATTFVTPRTPREELLTHIWCKVLHLEKVSIHDNFFELGGDSILSIQIISQANTAGLQLTPKQIFQHQTIASLAAVATTTENRKAEQGLVTGSLPLTPIQGWFFEQNLPEPYHWNQAFLLEVPPIINPDLLQQAVQQLLVHHDALRLRFTQSQQGWQQFNTLPDETVPFSLIDLSTLNEPAQAEAIKSTSAQLQASLNFCKSMLVQVALYHLGHGKPKRLLLVIHHLAVDGVSWRILLQDLETAYQQISSGKPIQLPAKTTSFKHWAEKLIQYARSQAAKKELTYWQNISTTNLTRLPIDHELGNNTEASARNISVSLNVEETRVLLQEVPKAYRTQINDILLTALVQVLVNWCKSDSILINLEGHGREEILPDVNLSRTVGWFTTIFPVLLKLEPTENIGDIIKAIKEQLRAIPNRGIGYGLLRYLSDDAEIIYALKSLPIPSVSFNYLGQFDWGTQENSLFKLAPESISSEHSQLGHRYHLLDINGIVVEGQLQLDWTYSQNFHSSATIENLAQQYIEALKTLIAHCQSPYARGYTPSDFPLALLDQQQLDRLLVKYPDTEDIYPLSPMQQLFYALGVFKSEVGFEQWYCTLQGNLNISAFQQAWQQAIAQHSIFRTAFVCEGIDKNLQIVLKEVDLPWEQLDWRGLSSYEQQVQLDIFMQAQQQHLFDLSSAPLMRITLIRVNEDIYKFIWCFQHLILDGWSWPLLLKEVFTLYEALDSGQDLHLKSSRPYRDYIAWLQQQNQEKAEAFWRQMLAGIKQPNSLIANNFSYEESSYSQLEIKLSTAVTQELQALARKQQLTLSTIVQGAWALIVSRYSGNEDVIFGTAVSGRPASLEGVESMVGMFINNLPVRVLVDRGRPLLSWLQELQEKLVELRQYEYTSLVQIQHWSEVPGYKRLFDSLVVFQNYRTDVLEQEDFKSVKISNVDGSIRANYPLTVIVVPQQELSLIFAYSCHCFDEATITQMQIDLQYLLNSMVANPQLCLEELLAKLSLLPERKAENSSLALVQKRSDFVAPNDGIEFQLSQIWSAVFGIPTIGVNDNFFELGGNSLLAISLISRLRETFEIELSLHDLFESPTIASLARLIESTKKAGSQNQFSTSAAFDTPPPLVPIARDKYTYIPSSFSQEYIWSWQQFYPDSYAYNASIALRFNGLLFTDALEKSINEIIRRHEILRTTFTLVEKQLVQVIAPSLTLPLKIIDLQQLPDDKREALAQKLANQEAQYHFNLTTGPLINTTLLRLSQNEHWLLITMHHIITDGWSNGILLNELETLYSAFLAGKPSPLPELPLQYADFALWERKWLNEEVLQKQLSYWRKKLSNIPTPLNLLAVEQSQHSTNSKHASSYSITLPKNLVTSIEALSYSQGVTIFTIILTALKILLFKWSGETDIIIVATSANRSIPQIEKMLGCFINDMLLRTQIDSNQTGLTVLELVKQTVNEAIKYQSIPCEKVNEITTGLEFMRTLNISMVPSVNWHSQVLDGEFIPVSLSGEIWGENCPLDLYVSYNSDEETKTIEIGGYYSKNMFTKETIERLFSSYQKIIQQLVLYPETQLSAFKLS
jgi:amino acid adenylation domain-containing protein/non-ribosomal peptide synthase protein (TIGR01720 family)